MSRIFQQEMSILFTTMAKEVVVQFLAGGSVKQVDVFGFPFEVNRNETDIEQEHFYSGETRSLLLRLELEAQTEGNLNYVSHSFLHMWGFSDRKEVLGKPIADLWESQDTALDALEAVRSNRSWVGELVGKKKDDSVFDVQILANIVENEAGKAICMMASVIDITGRTKTEEKIKEYAENLAMKNEQLKAEDPDNLCFFVLFPPL